MVEQYYTLQQAAKRLQMSPVSVTRMIDAGRLGATDLSNSPKKRMLRIPESALLRFLESRELAVR